MIIVSPTLVQSPKCRQPIISRKKPTLFGIFVIFLLVHRVVYILLDWIREKASRRKGCRAPEDHKNEYFPEFGSSCDIENKLGLLTLILDKPSGIGGCVSSGKVFPGRFLTRGWIRACVSLGPLGLALIFTSLRCFLALWPEHLADISEPSGSLGIGSVDKARRIPESI
jgi:hypothetical protein